MDHRPQGIQTNAVALGSISTEHYEHYWAPHPETDTQMAALHPLDVSAPPLGPRPAAAFLLVPAAGSVNGAVLPVDGGRAVHRDDPESQ